MNYTIKNRENGKYLSSDIAAKDWYTSDIRQAFTFYSDPTGQVALMDTDDVVQISAAERAGLEEETDA